jgi:hypothetical protein
MSEPQPSRIEIVKNIDLENFSFFDTPAWKNSVTEELADGETKESRYGSTRVMFNDTPVDCHVGIVFETRDAENYRAVLSIVLGEIGKSEIVLHITIRYPHYSEYHEIETSIKKKRDAEDTLPQGIGLALYKNALKNMDQLVQRMGLHPAIHTIIRSTDYGDTRITEKKWHSWFDPILEEFDYLTHVNESGRWEKKFS